MKITRLFLLTIKQTIKKPSIIVLLLIMPIIALSIKAAIPDDSKELHITAMYLIVDSDGDIVKRHMDERMLALSKNLNNYDGLFKFKQAKSMDELTSSIEKGLAECGYIIDADLYNKISTKKSKHIIRVITSDSTTLMPVINETLYALIFPRAVEDSLINYLENDSAIAPYSDTELSTEIQELYDKYFTNGSTFHFTYDDAPDDYTFTKDTVLLSPLRGLLSLIILIAGYTGGLAYYKEAENPVFALKKVRLILITVPTLLLSISAIISLLIGGVYTNTVQELLALFIYDTFIIFLVFVLSLLIKKGFLYAGILPVIILGCLVFTPIFIDLEGIIPILDKLSFIWPTKLYLYFFK